MDAQMAKNGTSIEMPPTESGHDAKFAGMRDLANFMSWLLSHHLGDLKSN